MPLAFVQECSPWRVRGRGARNCMVKADASSLRPGPVAEPPHASLSRPDDDRARPFDTRLNEKPSLTEGGREVFRRGMTGTTRSTMSRPQQPELARSGKGSTDQDSAKIRADSAVGGDDQPFGKVPEENQPGHHPEQEQDKPL